MGEKFNIRQFPQTRTIIGHNVEWAREVESGRQVAMVALVKGLDAKEVRWGGRSGGGPFPLPGDGGDVIGGTSDGAFADVEVARGDVIVEDIPC